MIHKYCSRVSEAMTAYIDYPDKVEWLTYGLELLVGEVLKFGVIIGIAYFLGLLPITVLILITALPYRTITGGGHSSSYLRCAVITISVYLILSVLANWLIATVETGTLVYLFPCLVGMAFLVVQVWVPGVELNINFQGHIAKERYKSAARIYLLIWIISCILVKPLFPDIYKVYFLCSMVGIAWQTLLVTPAGYLILRYSEKVFNILGKKEVL